MASRKSAPSPRPQPRRPRVALLVETSLKSGRDMLKGIGDFVREGHPWIVDHRAGALEEAVPDWLDGWRGDGIIARVSSPAMVEALRRLRLPVVDVLGLVPSCGIPLVHVDDAAIANLAAEHLLSRGFRSFGYFGIVGENWSEHRREAFALAIRQAGYPAAFLETPRAGNGGMSVADEEERLTRWIRGLKKPVGIMVCSDQRATRLLAACRLAGVLVPDEVAVIGVDNDEALCGIADPPLSSVWPAHRQAGYRAAAVLEELMQGNPAPERPVWVPPSGVKIRQSSDVLAIDDRPLALAVQFIRLNAALCPGVDDVAEAAGLSRSILQRRFRATFGKSVHDALQEERLKRARELLAETRLPLAEIAERCGFKHQEYFGSVFKAHEGCTPLIYRKSASALRQGR